MSAAELGCWNCGADLHSVPRPISRHEQCPECFEALHCCRFCRHYRTDVTGSCDEERADPPVVKENANFCDWFKPDAGAFSGARTSKAAAARGALDSLFGSDSEDAELDTAGEKDVSDEPQSKEDDARAKLDDLFK